MRGHIGPRREGRQNTMNSNRHPLSARLSSLATIAAMSVAISANAGVKYWDSPDYTNDVSISAAKVKLTWCKRNPFVITVR